MNKKERIMVDTNLTYYPDFVIHPGKSLKDELDFLHLTQVELAKRVDLSEKHISQIINGMEPISPETSIKFELAIGISANFWNNLQKNYELNLARIKSDKIINKEITEAKKFICYKELVDGGYVAQVQDWKSKTENFLKFFGVTSLSSIKMTEEIAFRQSPGQFNARSLAAWLRCGELDSKKIKTSNFDKKNIKVIIPKIRKLTLLPYNFSEKLREICSSIGIVVVYLPYFKKTKVSGSTRWIGDKPVIQLNVKGVFSDMFWFTFFHELGHIYLHGIKGKFIEYNGMNKNIKEREADDFAKEALIPSSRYEQLLKEKQLNPSIVGRFANSVGVDISIVLGRLAHEGIATWGQISRLRKKLKIVV